MRIYEKAGISSKDVGLKKFRKKFYNITVTSAYLVTETWAEG
jgi:hypothetical protein